MADPVTLRNLRDSFVNQNKPTRNYSSLARLKASGTTIYTLIYSGTPWPPGANILYAALRLWNSETWSGSVTITVQRLAGNWSGSRVNWNNKPGVTGPTYTLTKTDAAAHTMWEIPITAMMQLMANGGDWYGVQVSVSGSTVRKMHSTQAENLNVRPQMYIQWGDAVEAAENLSPDNNLSVDSPKPILTYDYTDLNGDHLSLHQIQISTDSTFATVDYDSGWVVPTAGTQFDTSGTAWGGLADGASTYWRVRVQDSSGSQSDYSLPAQFKYTSKGSLTSNTLGGPDGGGNYFVYDTTPPVLWTLTGRTQAAYQVFIKDLDNGGVVLFDSGKITGTTDTIDTGSGGVTKVLPRVGGHYELTIRVWDTIARIKTPDSSGIYYEYKRAFIYSPDNTNSAPTGLTATPALPYPWVDLAFHRTTPPDSFTIIRDGNVVEANLLAADLLVSGSDYAYRDKGASPRVEHTWVVKANVNGKDSPDSNSATATVQTHFTWMMEKNGNNPICLVKSGGPAPVVDANAQSDQEVHQPFGGDPILITQDISGFEGHVEAVLSDGLVSGLTARSMRDILKTWKMNPGKELILYNVDEAMTIVPYNITYRPRAKSGGKIIYDINFDFFQVNFR